MTHNKTYSLSLPLFTFLTSSRVNSNFNFIPCLRSACPQGQEVFQTCLRTFAFRAVALREHPKRSIPRCPRLQYLMFFHLSEELQTLEVSFFAKWEGSDAEQHQKRQLQSYGQWQVTQCLGLDHRYRSSKGQKRRLRTLQRSVEILHTFY